MIPITGTLPLFTMRSILPSISDNLADIITRTDVLMEKMIANMMHMTVATRCAGQAIENLWMNLVDLDFNISLHTSPKKREREDGGGRSN